MKGKNTPCSLWALMTKNLDAVCIYLTEQLNWFKLLL